MTINNETVGISAELAVADIFDVPVNAAYRQRGNAEIAAAIGGVAAEAFAKYGIPRPIKHIAEKDDLVDFLLENGETLSVKSNMKTNDKVAPQKVGQPTADSYFFEHFSEFYDIEAIQRKKRGRKNDEEEQKKALEKVRLFKTTTLARTDELMRVYWNNLFDCDYLLYISGVLLPGNRLNPRMKCLVFPNLQTPNWDYKKFSFTKSAESWNESCTVKYAGVTIGDFQVHKNRDNLKFRFALKGVQKLMARGEI